MIEAMFATCFLLRGLVATCADFVFAKRWCNKSFSVLCCALSSFWALLLERSELGMQLGMRLGFFRQIRRDRLRCQFFVWDIAGILGALASWMHGVGPRHMLTYYAHTGVICVICAGTLPGQRWAGSSLRLCRGLRQIFCCQTLSCVRGLYLKARGRHRACLGLCCGERWLRRCPSFAAAFAKYVQCFVFPCSVA